MEGRGIAPADEQISEARDFCGSERAAGSAPQRVEPKELEIKEKEDGRAFAIK